MDEELKPVCCGCGGEGNIYTYEARWKITEDGYQRSVGCLKCGIATQLYDTEAEAIQAWNKAMGKRTAKATAYDRDSKSFYATDGRCEGCGCYLERKYNFCPMCGAKLEWK